MNLKNGENVFFHFFEASLKSRDVSIMTARLIKHFSLVNKGKIFKKIFLKVFLTWFKITEFESVYTAYLKAYYTSHPDIYNQFIEILYKFAVENSTKKFIILIDGFEKVSIKIK